MPEWLFTLLVVTVPFVLVGGLLAGLERLPALRGRRAEDGAPMREPRAVAAVMLVGGAGMLAAAPTLGGEGPDWYAWMVALIGVAALAEGTRAFVPQVGRPLYWVARVAFVACYASVLVIRWIERGG